MKSSDKIKFTLADVCDSGLEDAWCYVVNKEKLTSEAARIVKPAEVSAFIDWIEAKAGLTDTEAERFLTFMKFPNVQDLAGYSDLLKANDLGTKWENVPMIKEKDPA